MKLRNKTTGLIETVRCIKVDALTGMEVFKSIAELNECWEDYTPKEPLIKDEKIRKAVRAWADVSGIEKVESYGEYFWIGFVSENTPSLWKFECNYIDASEFEYGKRYTIAELCGEEA